MEFLNGMNAHTLIFAALLILVIGYRFYDIFMAPSGATAERKECPPETIADGREYVPPNKNVLGMTQIKSTPTTKP